MNQTIMDYEMMAKWFKRTSLTSFTEEQVVILLKTLAEISANKELDIKTLDWYPDLEQFGTNFLLNLIINSYEYAFQCISRMFTTMKEVGDYPLGLHFVSWKIYQDFLGGSFYKIIIDVQEHHWCCIYCED